MEPGPRRRRRRGSHQLVATFLRDPGSGRVYRRGKLIGKGAFSRCYKLTDLSTSVVFALKVVPRGGSGAGRLRTRGKVEREIALHSRLRHRNIVALHGHFADRDHVYLVLEYCSRQSLAHVLRARQTLTEPEVRYYLRGLVSGLQYLHQRRIVHRDLKPKCSAGPRTFWPPRSSPEMGTPASRTSGLWAAACTPCSPAPHPSPRHPCRRPTGASAPAATQSPPTCRLPPAASSPASWRLTPPSGRAWTSCCKTSSSPRASVRTGCRPTAATTRPSSPVPWAWAGFSGKSSCCCPRADPPAPAPPQTGRTLTPRSGAVRPPRLREGLPTPRPPSACSPKGPSALTQQGLQGARGPRWTRPSGCCGSAWTPALGPHRSPPECRGPPSGPPSGWIIPASTASATSCRTGAVPSCSGTAPTWPCGPLQGLLPAEPRAAGDLHPEGRAEPAGRQAGRAAAPHPLPAAAAAAGGGRPARTGAARGARPLPAALPLVPAGPAPAVQRRHRAGQRQRGPHPGGAERPGRGAAADPSRRLGLAGRPAPRLPPGRPPAAGPRAALAAERAPRGRRRGAPHAAGGGCPAPGRPSRDSAPLSLKRGWSEPVACCVPLCVRARARGQEPAKPLLRLRLPPPRGTHGNSDSTDRRRWPRGGQRQAPPLRR
nr:inactive serine/threonine-protein kinase PLK5 isoform X1 [Oryctolagus cuniculus]XP_051684587.1 inactive serine/threonine-protein kinase PLK5 isoform X1 [Oryctolagus cuniculus]